jgi:large subunit ribosomal protein L10
VDKQRKERFVSELAERLRSTETLIVADYRGLTMQQVDALRTELLQHGARFQVVKNTLTRRAADEAGAEHLLALLEGPTAIAFLESEGDPVAVAKALRTAARETQVLEVRGGVMQGRPMTADEVASLATLPPVDVLRGQVLGAVTAPLMDNRRALQRTAAEPDRPHRRPHRAARVAGRHVGRRRAGRGRSSRGRSRSPVAEVEAEPEAPAAEAATTTEEESPTEESPTEESEDQ